MILPMIVRLPLRATLVLVLSLSLLAGCARKPPVEQAVDATAKRYASVRSGMDKQEVVIALGEPTSRQGARWRWEVSANEQSHASLELQFDTAERVAKITKTHVRRD